MSQTPPKYKINDTLTVYSNNKIKYIIQIYNIEYKMDDLYEENPCYYYHYKVLYKNLYFSIFVNNEGSVLYSLVDNSLDVKPTTRIEKVLFTDI